MSEIERIRKDVSLTGQAEKFGVKLERDGHEFVSCCPFHAEDTASFTIFTGDDHVERFHCFGCGAKGDVLDFVRQIKGVDLREAMRILGGGASGPNVEPKQIRAKNVYEGITPIDPPAEALRAGRRVKLYNPKRAGERTEWGSFAPSMVHPYRRADGSLIGYVLRHDLGDGGKETPMVMFVRLADGVECWCRFPFPKPRPLYGMERLGSSRQVILVEGEKKVDKLVAQTGRVVVAWAGGTQGARHADWTPLAGRNVVMWRDFDAPGLSVENELGHILTGIGCTFRVLDFMKREAA